MEKQNYWKEIKNTHFLSEADIAPNEGDIKASICIDAWKTDDDWEEGAVIAHVILSTHGDIIVSYRDPVARIDAAAQASIEEAKQMLREYWFEHKYDGTPAILVERDYKGEYERFALTREEFEREFPSTYKRFGPFDKVVNTLQNDGTLSSFDCSDSDTLKPMVHIWFCSTTIGSEVWTTFFKDMAWGLPQSDIDNGNLACIRRDLFGKLAVYAERMFMVGDKVYASDWCYGTIMAIEDGVASVEFDTAGGGGTLGFELSELKHAEN